MATTTLKTLDEVLWTRRRATLYLKQQRFTEKEAQYIEEKLAGSTVAEVKALGMDELRDIASETSDHQNLTKTDEPLSEVGEYLREAQRFTAKAITMVDQTGLPGNLAGGPRYGSCAKNVRLLGKRWAP